MRGERSLLRVVVIGNSGAISLDALRWLADVKVPLVHIDLEGRVLAVSAVEGTDNPALRRAQALATAGPEGLEIVRRLISAKLQGQLRVASGLFGEEGAAVVIEAAISDLETATSLDEVLTAEAVAASSYWPAWSEVPVRFVPRDLGRIPSHWTRVGQRRSPLSQSARSAVSPAHTILNYCYALLTAEARIACLTMGLDPGLGILRANKAGRDSLVADVMEVVRPDVDTFVLELLERRTFGPGDFTETRSGSCRVLAPLSHELAESAGTWSRTVGAVTEGVASDLARLSRGRVRRVPTPLTQKSRAAAVRQSREAGPVVAKASRSKPAANCRSCGGPVPRREYLYCEACRPAARAEAFREFQRASRQATERRRETGEDPTRTEEALEKLRRATELRNREAREWAEAGGVADDPEVFRREILPLLQSLSIMQLSKATGLSRSYARDVRDGKFVPHARHWEAFRRAVQGGLTAPSL